MQSYSLSGYPQKNKGEKARPRHTQTGIGVRCGDDGDGGSGAIVLHPHRWVEIIIAFPCINPMCRSAISGFGFGAGRKISPAIGRGWLS